MTTKTLDERISAVLGAENFMMMDIHRPPTNDEIQADPAAYVDKSLRLVQNDDSDAEGVGGAHEETSSKRCEFCFEPMPCAKHANVEHLDILTADDITVVNVLAGAHNAGLKSVVVVGTYEDGSEYLASSAGPVPDVMFLLQRGIHKCNKAVDTAEEIIGVQPPAA